MKVLSTRTLALAAMVALMAPAAQAQISVSAGGGILKLSDTDDSNLYLTGSLRLKLGGNLVLEPEAGYWKEKQGLAGLPPAEDLSLGVNLLVATDAKPVGAYAGVGIANHRLKGTFPVPIHPDPGGDSENRRGIQYLAGVDFRVSDKINLFATGSRETIRDTASGINMQFTKFFGGLRVIF